MKPFLLGILGLVVLPWDQGLAIELSCKVTDGTVRSERNSALESAPSSPEVAGNLPKVDVKRGGDSHRKPADRCRSKVTCLSLNESAPVKHRLCDSRHNVQLEAYTDNVLIRIVDGGTRRDLVRATSPMKGFNALSLKNETPNVGIQCELATDATRVCR